MKLLKGKVVSGIGDFSKKMKDIPGLLDAYERKTGMRFFPGTLNIQLEHNWSVPDGSLRLEKEDYNGTVSAYIVPCILLEKKSFILRTEKNEEEKGAHSKSIIEVASDVRFRDFFNLKDGDSVEVEILG